MRLRGTGGRWTWGRVLAVAALLLAVTALRVTVGEPGFGISFLALLPIVLAAFLLGPRAAWVVAGAGLALIAGSELATAPPEYVQRQLVPVTVVRLLVFGGVTALVNRLIAGERAEHAARMAADSAVERLESMVAVVGRAQRAGRLLAEVGRVQGWREPLTARLTALAEAAAGEFGEAAVVTRRQPDGTLRPVAAAAPRRPDLVPALLAQPPHRPADPLAGRYAAGEPFVVHDPATALCGEAETGDAPVGRTALVVPLVSRSGPRATLTFLSAGTRAYDDEDLTLAAELGRRVALMIEADEVAGRERQLHAIIAALSAAGTVEEAAAVLADGVRDALGAAAVDVFTLAGPDRLGPVHHSGHPPGDLPLDAAHPVAEAARARHAVWLHDRRDWTARFPTAALPDDAAAAVALPMLVGERLVGTLAAAFGTPRSFGADERVFLRTLAAQAALAFDRAGTADARIADGARLRSLVAGLQAVVWEADARTWEFTFVSERAEELLGYPTEQWLGDAGFWPRLIHPDDRAAAIEFCARCTTERTDYDFSYRALAADGRVVWLHDVVHVVHDAEGPRRLHGVLIDVTAQKRREQAAALLADTGRLLAEPAPVTDRLTAVAGRLVGELCDVAVVRLRGDDGRYGPVAAAPAEVAPAVLAAAPVALDELRAALDTRRAFVVPGPADDADPRSARLPVLGDGGAVVVPLVVDGHDVGSLSLVSRGPRAYDDTDLAVAEELGQRLAAAVAAERVAARQRRLQRVTARLAAAEGIDAAADALLTGLGEALGAEGLAAFALDAAAGELRVVRASGYPAAAVAQLAPLPLDAALPVTDAARTGEPVWLPDDEEWTRRYPHRTAQRRDVGHRAALAVPMLVGSRVVGVLGASFVRPRDFTPDERLFATTLAGQAAQAFQRAAEADQRRGIAETLQRSLLPPEPPALDRVALAVHYQPAATGTEAGGDWYDVLQLDGGRVAVVVGDVVGQGPGAAAVMGQLRSALAAHLLDGHGPAAALGRLSRFARRVPGARASTAVCVVLDPDRGRLRWARAGHPPPLVVSADGVHYLEDAAGTVLGLTGGVPYADAEAALPPGATVLLYTDGLVERRGEPIDDGLDRLAAAAAGRDRLAPERLLPAVLDQALDGAGPADDVAVVAARLVPAPMRSALPARPAVLRGVRESVAEWAAGHLIDDAVLDDLQLALGEAVANSIEHAYRDGPAGEVRIALTRTAHDVRVEVADDGTWRPVPADPGHRGRGLGMIRALGRGTEIDHSGPGTRVRFTVPVPEAPPGPDVPPAAPAGPRPAATPAVLDVHGAQGDELRLRLHGDLDLESVARIRAALLGHLRSAGTVALDLTGVGYLSSAGVGVLVEAAEAAPGRLRVETAGPAARILALTGLEGPLGEGPREAPQPAP